MKTKINLCIKIAKNQITGEGIKRAREWRRDGVKNRTVRFVAEKIWIYWLGSWCVLCLCSCVSIGTSMVHSVYTEIHLRANKKIEKTEVNGK